MIGANGIGELRHSYRSPAGTWCADSLDTDSRHAGASIKIAADGTLHVTCVAHASSPPGNRTIKHGTRAP